MVCRRDCCRRARNGRPSAGPGLAVSRRIGRIGARLRVAASRPLIHAARQDLVRYVREPGDDSQVDGARLRRGRVRRRLSGGAQRPGPPRAGHREPHGQHHRLRPEGSERGPRSPASGRPQPGTRARQSDFARRPAVPGSTRRPGSRTGSGARRNDVSRPSGFPMSHPEVSRSASVRRSRSRRATTRSADRATAPPSSASVLPVICHMAASSGISGARTASRPPRSSRSSSTTCPIFPADRTSDTTTRWPATGTPTRATSRGSSPSASLREKHGHWAMAAPLRRQHRRVRARGGRGSREPQPVQFLVRLLLSV